MGTRPSLRVLRTHLASTASSTPITRSGGGLVSVKRPSVYSPRWHAFGELGFVWVEHAGADAHVRAYTWSAASVASRWSGTGRLSPGWRQLAQAVTEHYEQQISCLASNELFDR